MDSQNTYLNEVMLDHQKAERALKRQNMPMQMAAPAAPAPTVAGGYAPKRDEMPSLGRMRFGDADNDEEEFSEDGLSTPVVRDYRITGTYFKHVVVSPNCYVVHTRVGAAEPVHIGLGISFRYYPKTDAFLIVPASLQTLIISARCISSERQGIMVQAYVQWIVDDIRTAYRKLDFSNLDDPLQIVNIQLREQAEAAIKDKVATMPIDAILSDKQPVIEELTRRLREVAEGSSEGNKSGGLGLKIVTVQIKEAVVSSTTLWENLQKPFRAERSKVARLADLESQRVISEREYADRQAREIAEKNYQTQQEELEAKLARERYSRDLNDRIQREQAESQAEREAIARRESLENQRREAELQAELHRMEMEKRRLNEELESLKRQHELEKAKADLHRQQVVAKLELETLRYQHEQARRERDLSLDKQSQDILNNVSDAVLRAKLIDRLPEIAAHLPKPDEQRNITIGSEVANPTASLAALVASIWQIVKQQPSDNQ